MEIRVFDTLLARENEWTALNRFDNEIQAELFPDQAPVPVEKTWRDNTYLPAHVRLTKVAAWTGGEIVGVARLWVEYGQTNQHTAWTELAVRRAYRRRGIGSQLLATVLPVARAEGRTLLMGESEASIPAGAAFAEWLGASIGLHAYTNRLVLAELDRNLIQRWIERAHERAEGFTLHRLDGAYPEELILGFIKMYESAMGDEPRGDLQIEDEKFTPEQLRSREEADRQRHTERWTVYVTDDATGEIVGYSQVYWNHLQPDVLWQGATGVLREYRGKGLGRWLKAAMLERVARERPAVKFVRTGNAHANAPMLKINYELGFKPYTSWTIWQREIDALEQALGARLATPVSAMTL